MNNPTATEIEERMKKLRLEDKWLAELIDSILKTLEETENEHNQPTHGQTR